VGLPEVWPVDGTTGYDALAEVGGVFVDGSAEPVLDALYRELSGDEWSASEHVRAGKRQGTETILQAEVSRLARLAPELPRAADALRELLVAFPVYRSYAPEGLEHLAAALATVRSARPDLAETLEALEPRLGDASDELCSRFQQTSGAVMAKGVEDTAFYRYTRFVASNEVGGDPGRFALGPEEFHRAQWERQQAVPAGMTTLSTHDTKRGEDVRARLAVLAEIPDEWAAVVRRLMTEVPLPDGPFAYLLWQTFAGAGFVERERMHAYAEKAMREAATSTTWTDPDEAFEAAVHAAVDRAYDDEPVRAPLEAFADRITPYGWSNSLAQKLVQLTMPGIPDVYQGTELWEDSLVDPDNRRPVDFEARRALLDRIDASDDPPPVDATGAAKMWVVSRTLRVRRDWSDLFSGYAPLEADGPAARHALAFDRGGVIPVVTRLPVGLERAGGWGATTIDVGSPVSDVLTGRRFEREFRVGDLLDRYPVALLMR
jgi:(1->4)-alpha-D-glucan 1-alpha-D-glucosylmutase